MKKIAGLAAIGAGYWIIFMAPVTTVTIDRVLQTVTHRRRGISGSSENSYQFSEISGFQLIEERDSDNDPVWSLGLDLRSGETVKISSLPSPVENIKRDLVFQANEFMGKQMPSYASNVALEGEIDQDPLV